MVRAVGRIAVAIALTWPLAISLDRIPLGTESSRTVPLFNLWTLSWTADRIPHLMAGWWDAPIFWPSTGTFAWSEPQLLTGAAFAILQALVGDRVAAYGVTLLLLVVLNGVMAARLARCLGADRGAAWCVGALGQSLPFVAHELGVIQLVGLWPVTGLLAALVTWRESPSIRTALEAGAFAGLTWLSCGYYGLFLVVAAIASPLLVLGDAGRAPLRRLWGHLALSAGVAAAIAGPVLVVQQRLTADRSWRRSTVQSLSARWSDWSPSGPWWPGWVLLGLAIGGVWLGRHRPPIRWLAATALIAVVGSLGARTSVLGWRPWWTLTDVVPGFDRLRSPFRLAAFGQLALVGCAVPAVVALWERRRVAVLGLTALAVVAFPSAHRLADAPAAPSAAAEYLSDQAGSAAVVALPAAPSGRTRDFERTVVAMLDGLDHQEHPLVNGYSGFFPDGDAAFRRRLSGFPDTDSLAALRRRDVGWAVVERAWFTAARRDRAEAAGLMVVFETGDVVVIRFPQ